MRLKSWGTAALCIATITLIPEYSTFVPSLRAQEANRQEQQHVIPALDGPTLFMTYCVVCHGRAADGRGPMAPILKTAVPDLTKIAKRNGGVFPLARVQNIIAGTEPSGLGHGTREMPVWGPLFSEITSDRDYGKVRLYNLAKYLESIQKK
jgi:mono/diheme cytochrome c family protein